MRPFRCEESDFRFFRWSISEKPGPDRPIRTSWFSLHMGYEVDPEYRRSPSGTLFELTIEIRQYPNAWFASKVTSGFTLHDLARIP
jgi:hypothetical protein